MFFAFFPYYYYTDPPRGAKFLWPRAPLCLGPQELIWLLVLFLLLLMLLLLLQVQMHLDWRFKEHSGWRLKGPEVLKPSTPHASHALERSARIGFPCLESETQKNLRRKKNCNAKKTATQKKLQRKKNCNAKKTAMQKKLQCKKNCNAKKTATQKKLQGKLILCPLVQVAFRFGPSPHPNLLQTHS